MAKRSTADMSAEGLTCLSATATRPGFGGRFNPGYSAPRFRALARELVGLEPVRNDDRQRFAEPIRSA